MTRRRRLATGVRDALTAGRDYYRNRAAWLALAVTSVALCYVGGLAMFWFHAVYLNEGGPAIPWQAHWLLDSSFGFVALTPVVAVILPFADWSVQRSSPRVAPLLYAAVAGGLFALVAAPGPLAHDMFVARGTWVANHVTQLLGDPTAALQPVAEYPPLAAVTQQLGAGLPVYVGLVALTVPLLRRMTRCAAASASPAPESAPVVSDDGDRG